MNGEPMDDDATDAAWANAENTEQRFSEDLYADFVKIQKLLDKQKTEDEIFAREFDEWQARITRLGAGVWR